MSAKNIVYEVSKSYGVDARLLRSKSQPIKLIDARIEAARRMRGHGMTQGEIAFWFNRDMATICGWLNPSLRAKRTASIRRFAASRRA